MKKKIGYGLLCFAIALGASILLTQPSVKDTANDLKTNYIDATSTEKMSNPLDTLIQDQKDWFIEKLSGS
ncbi:hypothetical protein [Listeria booriae]|uniref:hypothetical protein n=1 Tax=Listeria booriae TaxID=1552123 RepID=UPI001625DAFD|nr:hypothetical protein [Listeria booriae]MBC1359534.1 hypothetical protein [Listeria booriae]